MQKTIVRKKPRTRTLAKTTRALRYGTTRNLSGFKNSFNGLGGEISDKATRIVAKSIRKARAKSRLVGRYVSKKPYRSLGLAVAACLFLGYIANR